ncbi:MAG: DUF362 domain-containing protein [Bacteroidales bacterium]|nr:DUF362 domain-containing protein [Bacteroidales bacterium]
MKSVSRRNFLKSTALLSGTALGASLIPKFVQGEIMFDDPDIVSIPAADPMANIGKLIDPLGGIGKFVKAGQSVGFLVNSPWKHRGYYTHPDVALSMIKLCKDAGAGNIICYKPVREGYWEESKYFEEMKPLIDEIIYGDERITVEIPNGKYLKSAEVFSIFMDSDVFINIPVAKHHNGTLFSGVLKGLMGVSSRDTNRHMHSPDGEYTYEKEEYLSGCIADLNLIRKPALSVMDADHCALNNGPRGPGDTISPGRILAGTDPLAMDVYSASLIGMDPADIVTFQKAKALGLGNNDPESIRVLELG